MKIRLISLFFFLLCFYPSFSQLTLYNFENNLDDSIGDLDANYIEYGIESANLPNYLTGSTGQAILLDSTQGLIFPIGLQEQLDISTSLEIEFDFNFKEIGPSSGYMYLLSNQNGVNGNGFSIFARHDIFSDKPDYEIIFSYADGGFNMGIPDHPGHNETRIGIFSEGDLVNIRLILDFKINQWVAIANGNYTSAFFMGDYDFDIIKQSIQESDIFLGWTLFQEQDLDYDPSVFASSASFDNLAFYSPRKLGEADVLIAAINAMTAHVKGTEILSDDQLRIYLIDIQLNHAGNFANAEAEIYNFIAAYESEREPLFLDREFVNFSNLDPESQALNFLQQSIFDNQFVSLNIANMDGVRFEAAEVFPGKVSDNAPRVNDAIVEINGTYSIIQGARLAADLEDAKRPTGFYVAPGEIATVTIPESMVNAGLKAMIGAHDSDHSALSVTNRFIRISNTFDLNAVSNKIANPFGGGLYIKVPEGSDLGWVEVQIDGAVKSPYFSTRTDRVSNLGDFQDELAQQNVAWVDYESDKFMSTLPIDHVANIVDPTNLLDQWDNIMDGYRYVGGRPYERSRSQYFLVDSRLPGDAYGTGYPQVTGVGDFDLYPTKILDPEFYKSGFTITLHEFGHLALHPTLITEVETIVHLNSSYIYDKYYDLSLDTAFKYSAFEKLNMDEATVDWMIAYNFRNNNPMDCDPTMDPVLCHEVRYQHRGHAKYIELARLFGWSAVHGMNKYFYDKWTAVFDDKKVISPDSIILAASLAIGKNVAPLFHFWGLHPSSELAAQLVLMPKSNEILERLQYYHSIAPLTKEDFIDWYNKLYEKKGPPHYDRYNQSLGEFETENYGPDIQAQIEYLIATYFPAPSNKTDFLSFTFTEQTNAAVIDTLTHTINVVLTYGTNLTSLIPTFSLSAGANAFVNAVNQKSGETMNDFTNVVTYSIIAEDSETTQDWLVSVSAPNTQAEFTTFSFVEETDSAIIDAVNHTVSVIVSNGTSLTSLIATFGVSDGADVSINSVAQESGVSSNDFSNPVIYLVSAEDGLNYEDWVVTVTEELMSGMEEIIESGYIFYPNPTNNQLFIERNQFDNGSILLTIADLSGNLIENIIIDSEDQIIIDVSHYSSGMYLVSIRQSKLAKSFKFVKE